MQRGVIFIGGVLAMSLLLSACFRDASEGREDPTTIPIDQFLISPTAEVIETGIPTLTSTPEGEPSSTFPVGGPPTNNDDPTPVNGGALTRTPTRAVPSLTPRAPGTFGESGLTPTQSLPNQPVPDALITPTAFDQQTVGECVYLVQANDTLFRIAATLEVEVQEMIDANPSLASNPNSLQIGDELAIPGCVPADVSPTATTTQPTVDPNATAVPPPSGGGTYIVQEGDTLFRIAINNNTTVDALVAANPSLTSASSIIQPGQELIIPGQ
jgi:LysM repeat protein